MTYINYTIFILLLILFSSFLYIYINKNGSTREAATPNSTPSNTNQLTCPLINGVDIDTGCYDRQIDELTQKYNFLMARVPIKFYAGVIEYSYETDIPLVIFSGGVPYVYVNIRLPYPEPGNKGDSGDPGPSGITGSQGEQGISGLSGYSGSSYSGFLNSKLQK